MQIKKVFRQERKFLISGEQYYRFSRQFAELFKEDSHNGKDGYMVRSLYFDTLGNKDFEEKIWRDVECRRKMRLRIYSPQSRTATLEMKQKQGSNQLKRSLTISREHAEELMKDIMKYFLNIVILSQRNVMVFLRRIVIYRSHC
mgnify:CR=1 FL=1